MPSSTHTAIVPLRIFVVEDHAETSKYLKLYLEMLGHTVQTVRSITKAAEELPAAGCDVLISDINLPDGDGWELMHRLERNRPPYAIAVSGLGMTADRTRSRAAGFRHHLLKPFLLTELDPLLEEAAREKAENPAEG